MKKSILAASILVASTPALAVDPAYALAKFRFCIDAANHVNDKPAFEAYKIELRAETSKHTPAALEALVPGTLDAYEIMEVELNNELLETGKVNLATHCSRIQKTITLNTSE
ncbi:hypothetical protein AB4308_17885 [Vibrio breoganii]